MKYSSNQSRQAAIEMQSDEYRAVGHQLIDRIADYLANADNMPVSHNRSQVEIMASLGDRGLPEQGQDVASLLNRSSDLLFEHSVHLGHPRFWGYISGAPAPIGSLGDLLAAAVNPNVGGWSLSPMATEIEAQTIRWLGELVGYGTDCSGVLVSGGNMANFVPFLAARKAKASWTVRKDGLRSENSQQLRVYASTQTHTWVEKAADVFGIGTEATRIIPHDEQMRMNTRLLRQQIEADIAQGDVPMMVIATAGSTAFGAIDSLPEIAKICADYDIWFHIDGAYGAAAGVLGQDAPPEFRALSQADSIALDPHKWLYVPLEAGAVLVKDANLLVDTFAYHPDYYPETGSKIDYFEYGLQNSRGFRALKVWLALQQVGRQGYKSMISHDIYLAQRLYSLLDIHPEFEACTQSLSITTFRYVPQDLQGDKLDVADYLNILNKALVEHFHTSAELFLSNAVLNENHLMRVCIVNFRTSIEDIQALPDIVSTVAHQLDQDLRPKYLK